MVYFRKRLTPEIPGEINEMIVRDAKERQAKATESDHDDNDHSDSDAGDNSDRGSDKSDSGSGIGGNSGTMIVDTTCAPSHIRYPQDMSLLNEAGESAEKPVDILHDPADGKKAPHLPQMRTERLPEVYKMPQTHRQNHPQSDQQATLLPLP